jgi:hypothetical protein
MADRVRYATTCGAIYCKNRNGATLKTLALGPRSPPQYPFGQARLLGPGWSPLAWPFPRKTLERRAREERRSLSAHVGWLITQAGGKTPTTRADNNTPFPKRFPWPIFWEQISDKYLLQQYYLLSNLMSRELGVGQFNSTGPSGTK